MVHARYFVLIAISALHLCGADAVSCGRQSPDPECLDVFTHTPSHLPKCYCTDLCEEQIKDLVHSCPSNELHADGCGACLVCARDRGQRCGGMHNVLGVCAGGMVCKIKIPSNARDKVQAEQEAVGICVDDSDRDCPRSTDSSSERRRKSNISCRPGKVGIIPQALYCPTTLKQPSRNRNKLPTLIEILFGASVDK